MLFKRNKSNCDIHEIKIETEHADVVEVKHEHDWEPIDSLMDEVQRHEINKSLGNSTFFYQCINGDRSKDSFSYAIQRLGIVSSEDRVCLKCGEIDRSASERSLDVLNKYDAWKKEKIDRQEKAKKIVKDSKNKEL